MYGTDMIIDNMDKDG